ncbi:AAA family ATPase [Geodermatophilus sp. YIM 151500]|uniref:AAA family ATPase n=1 Tax=Geodermatophilus sp. YIM 151500 TaxID=2984531 RepID=UPI0021E393F9|nr:TOPRIM nucleotidyl transferase/hydrolase domain-containing protein [Geodermatophilus sp. YIM 151500]MCV2489360.1 AAA family ATPase [Geodermatophilus sp. YIM 151500]
MMQQVGVAEAGGGNEEMYVLKDQPEVGLRVAAFLKRTLGRMVELREESGFLDPYVTVGGIEYSLFRDEGHGLREMVVLLVATYRKEWPLLVVDEPELHLHPSMARLWLTELSRECAVTGRRAVVVTHEPTMLKPRTQDDLKAIWSFAHGRTPLRVGDVIEPWQQDRVAASLSENPQLMAQLAFSPRPVLVEGVTDVAALTVAINRLEPPEVVAQTDFVNCGGAGKVGLWFGVCRKLGFDVKAVGDLDAIFDPAVQRVMDGIPAVQDAYKDTFFADPPATSKVLSQLLRAAGKANVPDDPKSRALWLSSLEASADATLRDRILQTWRDSGLWLHVKGTLEDVLAIPAQAKGVPSASAAAEKAGPIDDVAHWVAYDLDASGELLLLLNLFVERLAHSVMEFQLVNPGQPYRPPLGHDAEATARVTRVDRVGEGVHRITVVAPDPYVGYSVEFSRETPATRLKLCPPEAA